MSSTLLGRQRGTAMTETAIFIIVLVFLLCGLLRVAISLITYHNLIVASREGVRVAATTPLLMANDSRIVSVTNPMITLKAIYSRISITNTSPLTRLMVRNREGQECSREVSVTVSLTVTLPFGNLLGTEPYTLDRTTFMRYAHQPLCT